MSGVAFRIQMEAGGPAASGWCQGIAPALLWAINSVCMNSKSETRLMLRQVEEVQSKEQDYKRGSSKHP